MEKSGMSNLLREAINHPYLLSAGLRVEQNFPSCLIRTNDRLQLLETWEQSQRSATASSLCIWFPVCSGRSHKPTAAPLHP